MGASLTSVVIGQLKHVRGAFMRRRIALVLGFTAVALAGPGMVPMASAGTNKTVYSGASINYASFKAYGDDLFNCDNSADGHHAVVRWVDSRNPSVTRVSRNYGGSTGRC